MEQETYAARTEANDISAGIQVRRVRGQPVDPQPVLVLRGEVRQLRGQVDVEVIPEPDQRG